MKTTRILALPAIAAASLLTLTGCFQLPPVGGNTGGNTGGGTTTETTPADPNQGGGEGAESGLADSSWSGSIDNFADFDFVLAADGTVDISMWNDEAVDYDFDEDVWTGDESNLTITITGLDGGEFDLTATGTATGGQMQLSGTATNGDDYTVSGTAN